MQKFINLVWALNQVFTTKLNLNPSGWFSLFVGDTLICRAYNLSDTRVDLSHSNYKPLLNSIPVQLKVVSELDGTTHNFQLISGCLSYEDINEFSAGVFRLKEGKEQEPDNNVAGLSPLKVPVVTNRNTILIGDTPNLQITNYAKIGHIRAKGGAFSRVLIPTYQTQSVAKKVNIDGDKVIEGVFDQIPLATLAKAKVSAHTIKNGDGVTNAKGERISNESPYITLESGLTGSLIMPITIKEETGLSYDVSLVQLGKNYYPMALQYVIYKNLVTKGITDTMALVSDYLDGERSIVLTQACKTMIDTTLNAEKEWLNPSDLAFLCKSGCTIISNSVILASELKVNWLNLWVIIESLFSDVTRKSIKSGSKVPLLNSFDTYQIKYFDRDYYGAFGIVTRDVNFKHIHNSSEAKDSLSGFFCCRVKSKSHTGVNHFIVMNSERKSVFDSLFAPQHSLIVEYYKNPSADEMFVGYIPQMSDEMKFNYMLIKPKKDHLEVLHSLVVNRKDYKVTKDESSFIRATASSVASFEINQLLTFTGINFLDWYTDWIQNSKRELSRSFLTRLLKGWDSSDLPTLSRSPQIRVINNKILEKRDLNAKVSTSIVGVISDSIEVVKSTFSQSNGSTDTFIARSNKHAPFCEKPLEIYNHSADQPGVTLVYKET